MILIFLLIISFFGASLFSSEGELFCQKIGMNAKEAKFKTFYQNYFSNLMTYESLMEVVDRFSFLFHYLEARNIGSLNLKDNKQVDLEVLKILTENEKNALVLFYLNTLRSFEVFYPYFEEKFDFFENPFCKAFLTFRESLSGYPQYKEMNFVTADFTFLIKNVSLLEEEMRSNMASDVHSSPRYFGMEYEPLERDLYQKEKISSPEDFENFYSFAIRNMKKKERTFFCGDIGGRGTWDLFVTNIDFEKNEKNYLLENKVHEKLYAIGVDFFSLVHAAYQLYCFHEGNIEDIVRFQVLGNHEIDKINLKYDKEGYNLSSFVKMISFLRAIIVPTEINFFLKNGTTAVLRHGFFPQSSNNKLHQSKRVNSDLKVIFLSSLLPVDFSYYNQLGYIIKEGKISHNPQYWSDWYMYSENLKDRSKTTLNLDVLLGGKNDGAENFCSYDRTRGYENNCSVLYGVEAGKKISIENIEKFNEDRFFSLFEIEKIKKERWTIFFGHSHGVETLWNSFCLTGNKISIHPYYVENKDFLSFFSLCGCHNGYFQIFNSLAEQFKEGFSQNLSLPGPFIFDTKESAAVNIFVTFMGGMWLRETQMKQALQMTTSFPREFLLQKKEKKPSVLVIDDSEEKNSLSQIIEKEKKIKKNTNLIKERKDRNKELN